MQLRNIHRGNRRDENVSAATLHQVWERLCSRMGNLGTYRLLQINGQRKFFDPLDDSPPLVEGCEVFIGRIPRDMFEDELVPLFAHYGPIHELRLMMNFSGTNRGFAFLMYKQPQFAEEAIRKLNDFEVRQGQFIGVIQSVNNRRLYIGRLHPSTTTETSLLKHLSTLTEGLQSLSLHVMKKVNEKPNRKYAIAVYVSHRHAAMARRFLILRKNDIFHQDVVVDWACPTVGVGLGIGLHKYDSSDHSSSSDEKRGSLDARSPATTQTVKPLSPVARNNHLHGDAGTAVRLQKAPSLAAKSSVETVDIRREEKPIRLLQPPGRHQRNDKLINAINVNKGLCYNHSRMTTPLYSLSPVPKPNSMLFLHPPPNMLKHRQIQGTASIVGSAHANGICSYTTNAVKEKLTRREEKVNLKIRGNRKPQYHGLPPRFVAMHCELPAPA